MTGYTPGGMGGSKTICKLQKKVIRLIRNVVKTVSCRELFKTLSVLPLPAIHKMEIVYYVKLNVIIMIIKSIVPSRSIGCL